MNINIEKLLLINISLWCEYSTMMESITSITGIRVLSHVAGDVDAEVLTNVAVLTPVSGSSSTIILSSLTAAVLSSVLRSWDLFCSPTHLHHTSSTPVLCKYFAQVSCLQVKYVDEKQIHIINKQKILRLPSKHIMSH